MIKKRKNKFYDTSRFKYPEIRISHRAGVGKRSPRYLLRCGCCDKKLEIYYGEDSLEIGSVHGTIDDWREILLPLLLFESKGGGLVDVKPMTDKQAIVKYEKFTKQIKKELKRCIHVDAVSPDKKLKFPRFQNQRSEVQEEAYLHGEEIGQRKNIDHGRDSQRAPRRVSADDE